MSSETENMAWLDNIEIVGGHPALDFVNTVHSYTASTPRDYLQNADHVIEWCRHMGLVNGNQTRHLAGLSGSAADCLLDDARALRGVLYAVFHGHMEGRPNHTALGRLNEELKQLAPFRTLAPTANGYAWHYAISLSQPQSLLAPIGFAAAELLQAAEMSRLKACPPPEGCGWLFLDRSRNGSRTWCNMKTCGNAAKQRRHRARTSHVIPQRAD